MKRGDQKPIQKIKKISMVQSISTQPTDHSAVRIIDYSKNNEKKNDVKREEEKEMKEKRKEQSKRHEKEEIVNVIEKPKEVDMGITSFVRKGKSINGLTKHLVSDFQVREIGLDNSVADIIDRENVRGVTKITEEKTEEMFNKEEWINKMRLVIGAEVDEIAPKIFDEKVNLIEIKKPLNKKERTEFHMIVKELPNYDSTCDNGVLVLKKGAKKMRGGREKNSILKCVLRKSNIDTSDAILRISKALNLGKNAICFAGMKDKRGVTCQYITIPGVKQELIEENLKKSICNGITLSQFEHVDHMIKLGDLLGNEFRVIIREVDNVDEILKNCESIKEFGYINYFGLQRFGSCGTTHLIGKALLKEEYQEAADLMMKEGNDTFSVAQGKKYYKEQQYKLAYEVIPIKRNIEKALMQALYKQVKLGVSISNGMFKTAIDNAVVYKTKSLYLHAYQSYVIIPLPAHRVTMPKNEIKNFFDEVLSKDGFTLDTFPTRIYNVAITGDQRKIVIQPKGVEYQIVHYGNVGQDLLDERGYLRSDYQSGDRIGLWIKFQLEPSAYATMLFRELLKMPTDLDCQKQLTEEMKEKMEEEEH
ncbi:tRNA pseudouridine synthase D, putative [Entamoeba histolytica HM-3:IMSS]|uniref:tRNA pseudouridine synthase D, putative n=1 Tax=Entamoeba histolytica HM-3:IMSS TaxID=885315 RepID=M7W5A5_ENTHI|nr:tRNA pseudouridine synthase D, putative [Entamoeba histolytica HM-3:IMSS]